MRKEFNAVLPSDDFLRTMIDQMPTLAWACRPDGSAEFVNRRWLDYAGLSMEEAVGWGWQATIHPEDLGKTTETWLRIVASEEPGEEEARVRRFDGEYRWFLFRAVPVRDEWGKVIRWYGTSTDIEDRKRAEEKLQRSEAYLHEAQRLGHVGSWASNAPSGYLLRIFGYDPDEKNPTLEMFRERIHPEDLPSFEEMANKARSEKTDYEFDYRIVLPDGSIRHAHSVGHPVFNDSGDLVEYIGTTLDVTERKRAEEKLRQSEGYLSQAQRLSRTGSFGWRVSTGEIVWSEETFRIFQCDPTTKPTAELILQRIHPEGAAFVKQTIERAWQDGKDFDFEHRLLMPDGSVKHVHIVAHAERDESGELEFVGAVMDVTAAKEAEERIRQDERELRITIDTIPAFVSSTLPDGSVDFISQGWLDYVGCSREEILGWGGKKTIHPEDLDRVLNNWQAALASGEPLEIEERLRRADGEYRWFLSRAAPLRDEKGNIVKWYWTIFDIEDRKQAEEKLRQDERELRRITDAIAQPIGVLAPDGSTLYANQVVLDYAGLSLKDIKAADFPAEITHPDDVERVRDEQQRGLSSGESFQMEQRVRRKDGQYRWFLGRFNPLRDDEGRIIRWYATGFDIEERKQAEERVQKENVALREEIDHSSMFEEIVGSSQALGKVLAQAAKVAPMDSTVLILGETGTGKELIARAIHKQSKRSARAFIRVNCAAIPTALIASELFGHEKGAFTGALQRHLGRFELANGGTIFLDEIGELPAETQSTLLRVLQEREFERVGGSQPISVDVRVLAATNRDLKAAVAGGTFREDLFYRLNVFPIQVPPLRQRADDIPPLVEYLIDRYAKKAGKKIRKIEKKTLELFQTYKWPGNVRELQNVVERGVILCDDDTFSVDETWLIQESPREPRPLSASASRLLRLDEDQEREMIEAALAESKGRVAGPFGAAGKLGIPRQTLESKIVNLGINKNRFRSA
jgi:formate hydrogenlyase transcriptional activator